MKISSIGHLKHYDKELPYIAYVKFDYNGKENRPYKPVEFYELLTDGVF